MKRVRCPNCGKLAYKRSHWKMSDGSFNRLYVHEVKVIGGLPTVTKSCTVREDPKPSLPYLKSGPHGHLEVVEPK